MMHEDWTALGSNETLLERDILVQEFWVDC